MERRYAHIIFDLDHTLWDFERNSYAALSELFLEFELDRDGAVLFDDFFKRYVRHNDNCWTSYRKGNMDKATLRVERFRRAFADVKEERVERIPDLADAYLSRAPKQPHLIDGAEALLEQLHNEGCALHLLTNGFREVQEIKLAHSGLSRYFDRFFSPEDSGYKKPHAGAYNHILEHIWARPDECLMIGDDLHADVVGAQQAGLDAVYFNPKGYSHRSRPKYEVQSLAEIAPIATQTMNEGNPSQH